MKMAEKQVPLWLENGDAAIVWLVWNGRHFLHDPPPPPPETWTDETRERYVAAQREFLTEVAEALNMVVWDRPDAPRIVPTSLQHRLAVVTEIWDRDVGAGRFRYRAGRPRRRRRIDADGYLFCGRIQVLYQALNIIKSCLKRN